MATEKKINYEMQGHKKPARNYLGKQKTVKNIPIKWKSGPKAPETELAYITKAEKNLLLKKDLHGSLKHGPNTGPDGIMSLDSQGDYTRDRSQDAARGQMSRGDSERAVRQEAHMKSILTGQKDIGQTSRVSDRTRRGAVSEYVNVRQADGSYKPQYVGSAYKDTGRRGWLSKLLGGTNRYGYAPVKGLNSIQTRGTPGGPNFGYYSDDEELGETKPGWGGRILGGLASMVSGIPFVGGAVGSMYDYGKGIFGREPKDMSQYNQLSLTKPEDQQVYIPEGTDLPMASIDRWTQPLNLSNNAGTVSDYPAYRTPNLGGTDQYPITSYADQTQNFLPIPRVTAGENEFIDWDQGAKDGGRIGYNRGRVVNPGGYQGDEEFEDENIFEFMQDQGIPHSEMAEGKSAFDLRVQELVDEGLSWQEAWTIASEEFGQRAEGESDQGIASIV